MPSFDFIVGRPFRESLEADYAELERCFANRAWKSVQVLAGSIVETILIDYLTAAGASSRAGKDPLKLDLADAITACRSENVLSARTADLCTVIRSYRNLIHPGRAIRLGEDPPNESSARIAMALIELIVTDVAKTRKDEFGLTADQIISKIERDENCLPILRHLLDEANAHERDLFLLEVLPARYIQLSHDLSPLSDDYETGTVARLKKAYPIAKAAVSKDALRKAAQEFVRVLRQGDGALVSLYQKAFFDTSDLLYLAEGQAALVKQHLLSKLRPAVGREALEAVKGIESFLQPAEVPNWLDPMVRTLISASAAESVKESVRAYLREVCYSTKTEVDAAIDVRLDQWVGLFEARDQTGDVAFVQKLKEEMKPDLPF